MMSAGYEDEQKKLRATVAELTDFIETAEQKSADVTAFIRAVQKYEHITELTPEIMHELIEKMSFTLLTRAVVTAHRRSRFTIVSTLPLQLLSLTA